MTHENVVHPVALHIRERKLTSSGGAVGVPVSVLDRCSPSIFTKITAVLRASKALPLVFSEFAGPRSQTTALYPVFTESCSTVAFLSEGATVLLHRSELRSRRPAAPVLGTIEAPALSRPHSPAPHGRSSHIARVTTAHSRATPSVTTCHRWPAVTAVVAAWALGGRNRNAGRQGTGGSYRP
jgi:hypothetical protein